MSQTLSTYFSLKHVGTSKVQEVLLVSMKISQFLQHSLFMNFYNTHKITNNYYHFINLNIKNVFQLLAELISLFTFNFFHRLL